MSLEKQGMQENKEAFCVIDSRLWDSSNVPRRFYPASSRHKVYPLRKLCIEFILLVIMKNAQVELQSRFRIFLNRNSAYE